MEDRVVNLFGSQSHALPPRRIDLARTGDIDLGPVTVIPSRRMVRGPLGEATLEPKVMQVLVALARPAGRIASRDDLIEACWEGRIVGDASINRVISLLRSAFRAVSGDAVSVETVPKVGYRLVADFNGSAPADAADMAGEGEAETGKQTSTGITTANSIPRLWIVVGIVGALVALGAVLLSLSRPAVPAAKTQSIALLGLATEGVDHPFFVQGFTSEFRDQLAQNPALDVRLPSKGVDTVMTDYAAVGHGRRIRVDYVWHGELRQTGDRTVLTSSLLKVDDGTTVWSDRLSSSTGASVDLPLRAARALVKAMGLPATSQDQALQGEEYRQYLTAVGLIRSRDAQSLGAARDILLALTGRHPRFAEGWSALAKSELLLSGGGYLDASSDASRHAAKALSLAPQSAEALKIAGMVSRNPVERVELLQRAVQRDPGDGEGWLWLSHVAAHPDFPEEERRALRRLAQIDPLWGLSWQASYLEVQQAGTASGLALERELSAAFSDKGTQDASAARMANLAGDLSRFHQLALASLPALSRDQQSMMAMQLSNMRVLMGLPPLEERGTGIAGVIQQTVGGKLPSRAALNSAGITPAIFWDTTPLVIAAPPQLIAQARGRELIALYDATFASPAALEEFANERLRPHHFIPQVATYVGFAMEQEGREKDAEALFSLAEKSIARWRANDFMWLTPLLFEANLAAARGQTGRAITAVEEMMRFGYPYALISPGVPLTGPLLDDPLWDSMQNDARLRDLLRHVRDNLKREREEVLRQTA